MGPHDRPSDDGPVLRIADLPYSFTENHKGRHAVLHAETAGTIAVITRKGEQRVWVVLAGEEIPVQVAQVLDETEGVVDGYPDATATDVATIRCYLWD